MEDWKAKYEEEQRKLVAELDELIKSNKPEDLDKRFFKDFGCINFKDAAFCHELGLARLWHSMRHAAHPSQHEMRSYDRWTCYHVTECTCGFAEACDSSD